MPSIHDSILLAINKANGKRRTRTINENDVLRLIGEAIQDGKATTGGGTVANCYGYPACQTVAEAIKTDDGMILSIGLNNANKGSAQRPNAKYGNANSTLKLSKSQMYRLSREQRITSGEFLPKSLHKVLVTQDHSRAVGNCETYTERVARLFAGQTSAPAKKVYDVVRRLFPAQVDRAVKAIKYANKVGSLVTV